MVVSATTKSPIQHKMPYICPMGKEIKVVITDIDGVWTDGKIYLTDEGKSLKAFNTQDSVGVALLRLMDIPVVIITGEDTAVIRLRAEQLKIKQVYTGVRNKLLIAGKALQELGFSLDEAAYIGDDIGDLPLLSAVGLGAVPNNAPEYLKSRVNFILKRNSGDGVFREFCELVAEQRGELDDTIGKYLERINNSKY